MNDSPATNSCQLKFSKSMQTHAQGNPVGSNNILNQPIIFCREFFYSATSQALHQATLLTITGDIQEHFARQYSRVCAASPAIKPTSGLGGVTSQSRGPWASLWVQP